jgi:hypothetical protein
MVVHGMLGRAPVKDHSVGLAGRCSGRGGAPRRLDAQGRVCGAKGWPEAVGDAELTTVDAADSSRLGCFGLAMASGSRRTLARLRTFRVLGRSPGGLRRWSSSACRRLMQWGAEADERGDGERGIGFSLWSWP